MLTESYGGKCPVCGYNKMYLRYGSQLYFKVDACPKCSFAFGCNDMEEPATGQEVWDSILEVFKKTLEEKQIPITIQGFKRFMDMEDEKGRDALITDTVWHYEPEDLVNPKYFAFSMDEVKKIIKCKTCHYANMDWSGLPGEQVPCCGDPCDYKEAEDG